MNPPLLVYGLARPHKAGSVCGNPCPQCGGDTVVMSGPGTSGPIEPQPLFIVREATYEEYRDSCIANGGGGERMSTPTERFYYVVSVD